MNDFCNWILRKVLHHNANKCLQTNRYQNKAERVYKQNAWQNGIQYMCIIIFVVVVPLLWLWLLLHAKVLIWIYHKVEHQIQKWNNNNNNNRIYDELENCVNCSVCVAITVRSHFFSCGLVTIVTLINTEFNSLPHTKRISKHATLPANSLAVYLFFVSLFAIFFVSFSSSSSSQYYLKYAHMHKYTRRSHI